MRYKLQYFGAFNHADDATSAKHEMVIPKKGLCPFGSPPQADGMSPSVSPDSPKNGGRGAEISILSRSQ
jgi:hypothetical protein